MWVQQTVGEKNKVRVESKQLWLFFCQGAQCPPPENTPSAPHTSGGSLHILTLFYKLTKTCINCVANIVSFFLIIPSWKAKLIKNQSTRIFHLLNLFYPICINTYFIIIIILRAPRFYSFVMQQIQNYSCCRGATLPPVFTLFTARFTA